MTRPPSHQLIPGVNVDKANIAAGLKMAERLGYGDPTAHMVTEYALMRHRRGEEDGAVRTWLAQYPHDLTSWVAVLAHAVAQAEEADSE